MRKSMKNTGCEKEGFQKYLPNIYGYFKNVYLATTYSNYDN